MLSSKVIVGCHSLTLSEVGTSKLRESLKTRDIDILKLSSTLFNPYRILIMRTLAISGEADFRDLKHALVSMTEGNLMSHLRALENARYVVSRSRPIGQHKSLTTFSLTNEGMRAFDEFCVSLTHVTNIGR